ncbi:hypothetical protein C8R48DRAFT_676026 [Suillus tomentosus]|nr:hypothetical protein C8R48DRAFT_676026 [Suillus tomentosus]
MANAGPTFSPAALEHRLVTEMGFVLQRTGCNIAPTMCLCCTKIWVVQYSVQTFCQTKPLGRFGVRRQGDLSATSVMQQLIQMPNIPTVVIHHTRHLPWVLVLVVHGTFMPPAAMSESSACCTDSLLKDTSEIQWYSDAEDDTPMVPPPAPANNGTLNSFFCHSGCTVKPTEKIRETLVASSTSAKWSAPEPPKGVPAPKRVFVSQEGNYDDNEDAPALEDVTDDEEVLQSLREPPATRPALCHLARRRHDTRPLGLDNRRQIEEKPGRCRLR